MAVGHESKERPDPSQFSLLSSNDTESLDGENIGIPAKKLRKHRSAILRDLLTWGLIVILATTVLVQALRSFKAENAPNPDPHALKHPDTVTVAAGQSGRCGSTSAEAVARGCIFDYMNFAWQPPECYDATLDEEHTAMMRASEDGPVRWWADAALTDELADDPKVLKWYGEVWVERRFHYKHCMYGWALLHKSYDDGSPLPDLMTYNHSLHCAHVLGKAIKVDNGEELLIEHAVTWYSDCIWPRR